MAKVLGKGLEALIKNYSQDNKSNQTMIAVNDIITNQHQPRTHFNSEKMNMLIDSIKEKGIIQPLTVRKNKKSNFELIAGERRLRAAKAIGLKTVPVFIISVNNIAEMMELALIENIQRVDLNPLEEAEGYFVLSNKYKFSQNEIAKSVAKSRSEITNKMRLLKLPEIVKKGLKENKIFYGHARALLSLSEETKIQKVYTQILNNKLSARQTEVLIKEIQKNKRKKIKEKQFKFLKQEQELQKLLKTNISIKANKEKKGFIKIKFQNIEKLEKIIEKIKK
tara:strand:+ start:317 stop:1156 length:840 start_codon:yes stop_codon:yes gene_type:complete